MFQQGHTIIILSKGGVERMPSFIYVVVAEELG